MQVDGAAWHRSQQLVIPENIRLLFQPAHSPELNPVEHVWEEIREKHFYNRVFNSIDTVMNTLCEVEATHRHARAFKLRDLLPPSEGYSLER